MDFIFHKEEYMKTKTWCPLFSGFYNSIWEMSGEEDEIDYYNSEENPNYHPDKVITYDDFTIDHKRYCDDVSRSFVSVMETKLKEVLPSIGKIIFEELSSPKEYNFSTDSIHIEVDSEDNICDEVRNYLSKNHEAWEKYLKDHYTSYDGFWSSYANDEESWRMYTSNYTDFSNGHHLGAILNFVCENEGMNELDDFYYEVMEGIYVGEYMTLS